MKLLGHAQNEKTRILSFRLGSGLVTVKFSLFWWNGDSFHPQAGVGAACL